jgi:hypothetical protein
MQSVDTNTVVTQLKSCVWQTLLQRIGAPVMTHLLYCTVMFVPLPNACFLQVSGPPVSEYKHIFERHLAVKRKASTQESKVSAVAANSNGPLPATQREQSSVALVQRKVSDTGLSLYRPAHMAETAVAVPAGSAASVNLVVQAGANSRKLAHDRILYCSVAPAEQDPRFTCFPPNRMSTTSVCACALHCC